MITSSIAVTRLYIQSSRPLYKKINLSPHVLKMKTQKFNDFKQMQTFSKTTNTNGGLINRTIQNTITNLKSYSLFIILAKELKQAPKIIKDNSICVFKSCIAQIEYVLAYRIRRGQQIIQLYSKLWNENALMRIFQQIRRLIHRRGKEFLLGSGTLIFDWKSDRISDDELKKHVNELELCRLLREKICDENICLCEKEKKPTKKEGYNESCWSPFIKQNDLIVWKREEKNHKGLYSYKMYAKYLDVSAKDFLEVFLDIDNRTKWDQHVVQLKVIDSEPDTHSDVIYWETKWPKLFSNRDYVFTRRYMIDEREKVMIVMNRSTQHPDYPAKQSKSRVTEYWSYMVIKPTSEFNQPGIEFSLTYFDNPGMSLPSALSLWVSSTGMPEYIKRLRIEALKVSDIRKKMETLVDVVNYDIKPTDVKIEGEGDGEGEPTNDTTVDTNDTEEERQKENEPPPPSTGGGGDVQTPVVHPKDISIEPFLIWASFIEKLGANFWTWKNN